MSFSNNLRNYQKNIPNPISIYSYRDHHEKKPIYINLKKINYSPNHKLSITNSNRYCDTLDSISSHNKYNTLQFSSRTVKEKNNHSTNKDYSITLISKKIKEHLSKKENKKPIKIICNIKNKERKVCEKKQILSDELPKINNPKILKQKKIIDNPKSILYPVFKTIKEFNQQNSERFILRKHLNEFKKEMSRAVIPAFKQVFMLKKELGLDDKRKISNNLFNSNTLIINDKI